MQAVSTDYKSQINKTLRNVSYIKVTLGIVEVDAPASSTITSNGELFFSDTSDIDTTGLVTTSRYATMEHNRFILDGKQTLPPESNEPTPLYQGYVGDAISDANGLFTVNPELTINFAESFNFVGLTFNFDTQLNCYPTEMQVIAYNGVSVVKDVMVYPTSATFILDEQIPSTGYCDKIKIIFKKTFPFKRRVVLESMLFGVQKTFTDETITTSVWKRDVDLLSTKIPNNSFEFTTIDINKDYNPDNATGFWQYIEQSQPIDFFYGYELDNGTIEWVKGGTTYLDGEIKVDSSGNIPKLTLRSTSLLNQLNSIYYDGIYRPTPISLYDLALEVLTKAELPAINGDTTPYYIDTALQSIYTSTPLPEVTINSALQLIANAGRCAMFVDRDGFIHIKRVDPEVLQDFSLDFSNMKNVPLISKLPPLYAVQTSFTNFTTEPSAIIYTADVAYTTATECTLKFPEATNVTFQALTGVTIVVPAVITATSCVVTIIGTGKITVTGTKLIRSKTNVTYVSGETGQVCTIDNALINKQSDAIDYAQWVASILNRRNQYSVSDRGFPELDMLDLINVESLYSTGLEATVVKNELTYNGGLSATTTYITKEVT